MVGGCDFRPGLSMSYERTVGDSENGCLAACSSAPPPPNFHSFPAPPSKDDTDPSSIGMCFGNQIAERQSVRYHEPAADLHRLVLTLLCL